MSFVTLKEESKRLNGFYVPLFEVRIKGAGLPQDVLRDVTQISYTDNIKSIDSFELTVNNWDPTTNAFKYVGAETKADLEGSSDDSKRYKLFEPCNQEVEVHMGYLGNLILMVTGQFTTMEPNFPSGGAPTLTVRGLNVLHKLRRKQNTHAWVKKKDSEIAKEFKDIKDPATGKKLEVEIDPNALSQEEPIEYVAQTNQYDIDFLLGRARERGYVLYVKQTDDGKKLYFGPSGDPTDPVTYELKWGQSLVDFKPTLTTANQVASVTVNGWNRRTKKAISEKVTLDDLKKKRNKDLYRLLDSQSCGERREEIVVDEPVFTPAEARKKALAILSDQQKVMVTASGTTVGLPELRAGRRLKITGLGSRFSGTYFLTETTHSIGENGYTTRFKARREDDGGGTTS